MRKVLSLILVFMMLVSIVPVSVFADEAEMPAEANDPVAAEAPITARETGDAEDPATAEEDNSTTPEIIASGCCGGDKTAEYDSASGAYKNLSWTLDEEGMLTVYGTGAMYDATASVEARWYELRDSIMSVVISDGVTSIGNSAFANCVYLESIDIPDSVTSIGNGAFYSCLNLASIEIPDDVTSIGSSAFNQCEALTRVTIPNGVTSISDYTFAYCISLESIDIPDGVTSIGDYAFNGCRNLKSVMVPDSVTSIGDWAFSICGMLASIGIPDSVTSIGDRAFYSTRLTSIEIPNSVTSIGDLAFYQCFCLDRITVASDNKNYISIDGVLFDFDKTELIQYPTGNTRKSYIVPDSVTSISHYAFGSADKLTSVTIPASVKSIGDFAFQYCYGLEDVNISEGVTNIGSHAFTWCKSLEEIEIPGSVTSIGDNAFSSSQCFITAKFLGDAPETFGSQVFDNCSAEFTIYAPVANKVSWQTPETYDTEAQTWHGYPIRFYGDGECAHVYGTAKYAPSCTQQGFTMYICSKCNYIYFGDYVEALGHNYGAWQALTAPGCTSEGTEKHTCSRCKTSETRQIPALGHDYVDGKCTRCDATGYIASGYCGGDETAEYDAASSAYKNLTWTLDSKGTLTISGTGITMNPAFQDMPWQAFASEIKVINIEEGVTGIGYGVFSFLTALEKVILPDSLEYIYELAFSEANALESIFIPENVCCIQPLAFSGCDNLKRIEIADNNPYFTVIDDQTVYTKDMKSIVISVTKDTAVVIPDGVTDIFYYAFADYYTNETIESVTIPSSVEAIGMFAFGGCSKLELAKFEGDAPKRAAFLNSEIFVPNSFFQWLGMDTTVFDPGTIFSDCAPNFKILAPVGNTTWTGEGYDAQAKTWYGYPIEFYGEAPATPEILASGYCGADTTAVFDEASGAYKNLRWELDDSYTLIISGTGDMAERPSFNTVEIEGIDRIDELNVIIEEGVTSIGARAFADDVVTNVSLPQTLERIDEYAFADTLITSIDIPENVTYIGKWAFADCGALESFTICGDVDFVGEWAFADCGALESFTICGDVDFVGEYAFARCGELKTVSIPGRVKELDVLTFWESGVQSITIPEGTERVGGASFYLCSELEEIYLPASMKILEPGLCIMCPNLHKAVFAGDAPAYQPLDVYDYSELEESFADEYYMVIAAGVFYGAADDFAIYAPICNTTWKGEGYDAEAQTWNGWPIRFYGEHSYAVTSVTEATCTEQGEIVYTCSVCGDSYTEYTPALGHDYVDGVCTRCGDVTTVGGSCGDAEWELSPDGTLTIGGSGSTEDSENPWEGIADRVTDIKVGSGVTELDFDAFDEFENLENINISGSSQNFSSINGVVYNKNANELIYCPRGKTGEYEVHGGLKTIRAYAFAGCTKLQVMVIANSITEIGDHAFDGCSSLVNVAFTDSEPRTVGKAIFDNCAPDFCISAVNANGKWLKSARYDAKTQTWNGYPIRFGERTIVDSDNSGDVRWDIDNYGNLEIGSDGDVSTAADLSNVRAEVKTVSIAEGTTGIAAGQFENFENLEAVSIPDTVTEIGDGAFAGCENLYELSIPESVTDIGNGVFAGCDKLTEINVDENNPNYSSVDGKLYNKDRSELICVPAGAGDESFTVPDTVDKIGDGAFSDCGALTEVVMTEGITEIGAGAFAGCDNLENIKVENPAPKRMLMAARLNAAADVTVTISLPASVKVIGENAFRGCDSINVMNISANVEVIGSSAFADCENLTAINVNANNANYCSVNGMLLTKDGKTILCVPAGCIGELTLPDTLTAVADGAFDGCTTELTLLCPDALKGCFFGKCVVKFASDGEAHSYEKRIVAPTCTEAGYTVVITDGVEGEHSDIIEKIPHKYGAWHVSKAASCTEDGVKERCCACCGDAQTSVIECGHSYSYVVIPATCTADGCTRYTCDVCGDSYETDIIPACHELIHHDGKAAACTENGWEAYDTCSRCDYTTYKEIPAKGHSYTEAVTAPTCTEKGYTTYTCECGDSYVDSYVDALGHHYVDGVCTECGDAAPVPALNIIQPSRTNIKYGETLVIRATVDNAPEGAKVVWNVEGKGAGYEISSDGMTCYVSCVDSGSVKVTATLVDENGNAIAVDGSAISDNINVSLKSNLLYKIISWFKNLFKIDRRVMSVFDDYKYIY